MTPPKIVEKCPFKMSDTVKLHASRIKVYILIIDVKYRKYRSLGTPPRLTFQTRLLHNQEGVNAEKGGFRKILSRAFFRRTDPWSHLLGYGAIEPGKSV